MDRFAQLSSPLRARPRPTRGLDICQGGRPRRRRDRHRHRRPDVVPGLPRHAARPRPGPRQSVRDPGDHPQHGRRLGVDGARHEGPARCRECTACAASNMAIGDGTDAIRLGRADVMFCGGTEAAINKVGIAGFGAMRALSRRNDDPTRASRPFDASRDGFVMGEAAAVLVLEELEHAQARGAKIYARDRGLRRLGGREPHHRARSDGRQSSARADDGAWAMPVSTPDGDRLHQRARDVDADRRLERDARHQARDGRGARATRSPSRERRARPGTASAPPARSRRCSRRSRCTKACCRRRSTTSTPIPSAISTTSRTWRARPT